MAKSSVQPLSSNFKIVDEKGYPNDYFIRFMQQQLAEGINSAVPSSRKISTGVGLSGGGDLSVDRTISLNANLDDLLDVDLTVPPTNAQVLTYVAVDGKWEARASAGGGGSAGESAWLVTAVGTGAPQNINIPDNNPPLAQVIVSVNGLRWQTTEYSIAGTVLTLTTNSIGDTIEIVGPVGTANGGTPFLVTAAGTGVSQVVALPYSGLTSPSILVYVNGLRWQSTDYSISGSNVTLTTNSAGDTIEIIGVVGFAQIGGGGGERTRVIPKVADYTPVNFGAGVAADKTYGLQISQPSTGTNIRFLARTAALPVAPYDVIMRASPVSFKANNGYKMSLILRNSATGNIIIFGNYSNNNFLLQTWSSFTSFSGNIGPSTFQYMTAPPWIRVQNDGTNLNFFTSPDGVAWHQEATTTIAGFIGTIDQIGFGQMVNGDYQDDIFQSFEVG